MIERTFDTGIIHDILKDKRLRKLVLSNLDINCIDPANQPDVYYLLIKDKEKILGYFLAHTFLNKFCLQAHINYKSEHWGQALEKYSKEGVQWVFKNTPATKIYVLTPTCFPFTKRHALKTGFEVEGYLTDSAIYNGKLTNNYILGISK